MSVGASLVLLTEMVNVSSVNKPPESVVRTRIEYEALVSKSKIAAERSSPATMEKLALSVSPAPLASVYVNESPTSTSVLLKVPTAVPLAAFSLIELLLSAKAVGASLTLVTVASK